MSVRVVKHDSARSFLNRSLSWLLESEAENNLILGIAREAIESDDDDQPIFFATVESEGYVVGCAFRTPPFKLGLTAMPLKAVPPLADVVATMYEGLPGVLGPREEARYFSRVWCGPRALSFRPAMDQRIYRLDHLAEPDPWPEGRMRAAGEPDKPVIIEWLRRFFEETRMPVRDSDLVAGRLVSAGDMYLWVVEGIEVSMAGITGQTPHGARIGFVYTPPAQRGKGHGTAITAALTRKLLEEGKRFCFLFTDASNSTSNRIYQRLGYRAVADVVDFQFY